MNTTNDTEIKSEVIPEQLGNTSQFRFQCHKGVKCFTKCCRGIDIMLTPYDILTMKKRLDISSDEFLALYTDIRLLEKADMPVVTLKLLDDDQKSCPFVRDEEGCIIYEDRPSTCRYYPLGMGALSYAGQINDNDAFFFMVKESHCLGFQEEKTWSVADWREDQGVNVRDEVNAGWTDLIVKKKTIPASIKLTEKSKQLFFMVCYNIDKFKRFVFESSFLEKFSLDDDRIEAIRNDDVELLKFGFEWLKSLFFEEGNINITGDELRN
ncbi:MAG: YkgJ family cysteine cluster protein [Desulfamplus sp.]|nr:YkgJ family cysteine cluster protein [Desulfamplus sp.]